MFTPFRGQAKLWMAAILDWKGCRRHLLRSYLYDVVGCEAHGIGRSSEGLWIFAPTNDHVGHEAFVKGDYESGVMADAISLVERHTGRTVKGRTFVDVGANIGTTTIAALFAFGASDVVAIEPSSENLRFLRVNLAANSLEDRVRVIGTALSDRSGQRVLEFSDTNSGDHRLRSSGAAGAYAEDRRTTAVVKAITFDDLALDLNEVGLVWMDTQGHEAQILTGASTLLASDVPVITEYWPYGLRRCGGLDDFHQLVRKHYRSVVNVRTGQVLAADHVGELEQSYTGLRFTDLALIP